MEPLISVVIVTYNRAHFLKDALDSIKRQTFKDYEIILVDDGSTDNTKEIVEMYEGIHYIYQEHAGISRARNTGWNPSPRWYPHNGSRYRSGPSAP